jgi:hypothetical protein
MGPLGKMHNIVVHIRGSTTRIAEFLEIAERRIPLDNCTRWNSWYTMLVIALELRPAVEKYFQNHESDLEDDELSNADWRRLRTIMEFLKPFSQATLYTEGDSAAIDRVLFSMDVLIIHFERSLVSKTFLKIEKYLLYDRPNIKRIKILLLGLIKDGKSLTSII